MLTPVVSVLLYTFAYFAFICMVYLAFSDNYLESIRCGTTPLDGCKLHEARRKVVGKETPKHRIQSRNVVACLDRWPVL